jgi:hypothetical protein
LRATATIAKLVIVALILLALGLGGCGGGGGGQVLTLSGVVRDDGNLTAVASAHVSTTGGQSTLTDANGQFSLGDVSSGSGTVSVAMTGYDTKVVSVPAGSGGVSLGTIYLQPAAQSGYGRIVGSVTEAGVPAAGATLQAGGRTGVSKADGSYAIYNVPAMVQTVLGQSANGFTSGSSDPVQVPNMGTITASPISLSTEPPPPPPL